MMAVRRSRLIAAMLVALGSASPAVAADPQPFEVRSFVAARQAGQPVLIAVHAAWCPTCLVQKAILHSLTASPEFDDLAFFIVDFDRQKNLARFLGARAQSTLIAFKGEREVARSVGDTDIASIQAILNKTQ